MGHGAQRTTISIMQVATGMRQTSCTGFMRMLARPRPRQQRLDALRYEAP